MQFVATCEKISEAYLLPVIRQLLEGFPFVILGFHSDNGSEYINYKVAKLLEKLLVEFTKSRPRHSNDNALAESKNASVVRKHFGYAHIPQYCASLVNAFCTDYLKACMTFEQLDAQAAKMSGNDAALVLNNARKKLFKDISALIRKQA